MIDPQDYVRSGKHLPDCLKDFHDQKDVFKTIQDLYINPENPIPGNFRDNMIYTIDFFLWFMAQRGYTLQKSRAKVKFRNLADDVADRRQREIDVLNQMFSAKT